MLLWEKVTPRAVADTPATKSFMANAAVFAIALLIALLAWGWAGR